ncbi:DUF935 domain-containing protein [Roseospirillum parvum]|uniref:Mu-like prophage protein gp29 n=1 Tax=Roseospirillum parvum TaxID=83401 RepID=A0A1G8GCS5_9PROT|nr:DUF935 family protein [Roseospirillum parvum]SDH92164.1 Mu-like prophage protein gp29 [Roseospirillum parvum]
MAENTPQPDFQEIAVASADGEDITASWVAELRQPRDEILRTRGRGDLAIYERLKRDDQVHSCWQQRVNALVSREWTVEPGGPRRDDRKAAAFVEDQLKAIRFDNVTKKMLNGVFYGYGVAECLWAPSAGQIVLDALKVRRTARFRFGADGTLRLLAKDHPEGLVMPPRKFWTFSSGGEDDDDPYGRGLAHYLYWPVWLKRNGVKFWSIYLEKFASPTAKGTLPSSASTEERRNLLEALRAITQDSSLVVSEGTLVELLEATRQSGGDYAEFYRLLDGAISKIILSQTMTTDDGSSLSQAQVHQDVKLEVVKADADLICESFTDQVIRWLVDWNFPGAAKPWVWRDVAEPEDLKTRAERDRTIYDMGYQPTQEYIDETYGEGFERRAEAQQPPTEEARAPQPAFAEQQDIGDDVDALVGQLEAAAGAAMDAMIDTIRQAIDDADSIPDAMARIERAYPDLALDDLADLIARAATVADLSGRAEVGHG